jgi:NADH:ubiquinone oxidoreductase subunit 4 (subunit M)
VLLGTYKTNVFLTVPAALGLVLSVIYALWMIQRAFYGPLQKVWRLPDLSVRETAMASVMAAGLLWLGLNPQPVLDTASPALSFLQERVATVRPDFSVVKRKGNDPAFYPTVPWWIKKGPLRSSPLFGDGKVRVEDR